MVTFDFWLTEVEKLSIPTCSDAILRSLYDRAQNLVFEPWRRGQLEQGCAPIGEDERQYWAVREEMRKRGLITWKPAPSKPANSKK